MTDNESRIISVDELINNRRSIRKYKADMPPLQWIDKMIECAVKAPSPSNSQPVRFIRISSRKSKKDLYQAISSNRQKLLESVLAADKPKRLRNWINTYYRFSEFMFNAPLLFAIGTILPSTGFSSRLPEANLLKKYSSNETDKDISVGLALKGFILKGEAIGLGSCILTAPFYFVSDVEKILNIKDIRIKCFVTVGFPDEKPRSIKRKPVSEVYWEI